MRAGTDADKRQFATARLGGGGADAAAAIALVDALAADEVEASGGARSEALPLLHRCTSSSDGLTAPIHATERPARTRPMDRRAAASGEAGVSGEPARTLAWDESARRRDPDVLPVNAGGGRLGDRRHLDNDNRLTFRLSENYAGPVSLEFDVYTLCHREAHVIETFLTAYADPDELTRRHPGQELEVERPFVGGLRRRRWIPVESVREAVEFGLAHPDWAFVELVPAAATVPTDYCCMAFTRDNHVILGLDLVDPGCAADDGREVDPVLVLETLVEQLKPLSGFVGWEVAPFETAREFEQMLRGERRDEVGYVRLDLPRWFRGTWLTPL